MWKILLLFSQRSRSGSTKYYTPSSLCSKCTHPIHSISGQVSLKNSTCSIASVLVNPCSLISLISCYFSCFNTHTHFFRCGELSYMVRGTSLSTNIQQFVPMQGFSHTCSNNKHAAGMFLCSSQSMYQNKHSLNTLLKHLFGTRVRTSVDWTRIVVLGPEPLCVL